MMKRQPRSTSFEFIHPEIPGDELENNRIQLEHNLQNTDLSFHLSSDSIEYPRHNSGPSQFQDFGSFIHHSRADFGDHPWSYRTGDDEEGINPYGGETMSTAAHHASALTLTAGLGGGRGARRDASLSGAEYDPDRPLENIIGGVDSRFSLFDLDPSRSKYSAPGAGITLDPLVVDSTAELDRILESGHAPPPVRDALNHSSSSASSSDSEGGPSSRPKISDALRRVSFSPKRPRAHSPHHRSFGATQSIINTARHAPSPLAREASLPVNDIPTPKARQTATKRNSTPYPSPQPEVRLQPPTPSSSSSSSKFSQKARTLTRELDAEVERARLPPPQSRNRSIGDSLYTNADLSSAANDIPPISGAPKNTPAPKRTTGLQKSSAARYNASHSKLHLPDVTGLTNAVESPAKGALANHYPYQASNEPRDIEVRLLTVMNTIQDKLEHLEDENSISRRRVRELEHELEMCKKEVAKERTRVLQREDSLLQNQRELERAVADARRNIKGKARARDTSMTEGEADASMRYREAVEEKKALESLIITLRSHLTRLTAELSSHQQLLVELRSLRESDARALKEKSADISRLRNEVERLAGEVEVLRGVVEEGLKERRLAREKSQAQDASASDSVAQQEVLEETEEAIESSQVAQEEEQEEAEEEEEEEEEQGEEEEEELEDDDEEPEPFDPISIPGSSRDNVDAPDRTVRTDHATVGTPGTSQRYISRPPARFIDEEELQRIAAEVEDRRSERSGASHSHFDSRVLNPSRSASPAPVPAQRRAATATAAQDATDVDAPPSPALSSASARIRRITDDDRRNHSSTSRPSAPRRSSGHPEPNSAAATVGVDETPFPQIRGERLEKLFFSAPEHNQKTCTVCRRRGDVRGARASSPSSWLPSHIGNPQPRTVHRRRRAYHEEREGGDDGEDEGFAEGSEEAEQENQNPRDRFARRMGKQREPSSPPLPPIDSYERRKNLPQQTVLARVIRELEDDFTHYKSVYVELADQYKDMDPVSDVPRRNMLAQHLREVVDVLEQKGDQIASLYDLLTFKDKTEQPQPQSHSRAAAQAAANALRAAGLKRHPTFA